MEEGGGGSPPRPRSLDPSSSMVLSEDDSAADEDRVDKDREDAAAILRRDAEAAGRDAPKREEVAMVAGLSKSMAMRRCALRPRPCFGNRHAR